MKEFVKLYHLWYYNMQQGQFGAEISLYLFFFIIFPYFLKFSSVLMNMQIR